MRRPLLILAIVALVAGCTGGDEVVVETARVGDGEVVQTVAAPARIEPQARATVSATVSGEVAELLVTDGDEVAAGDPLVRLTSESLDGQVAQAEAAVAATRDAGQAAMGAGVDFSPALGALRGQVDGVFPPLLSALEGQVATTEASLEAAIAAVAELDATGRELRAELRAALEANDLLDAAEELDLDDLDDLADAPDTAPAVAALEDALRSARDARGQLATTRGAVNDASAELAEAERSLSGQAAASEAAQTAAVEAQIEQAERALAATEARMDELVVTAPISGVVELARGSTADDAGGGFGAELGGLGELGDLGDLGGLAGDSFSAPGGGGGSVTGPITVGRRVSAGQELVRIFDLSSFHAELEVNELDVVEVEVGQPVTLTVDAYPGAELDGTVEHVAYAPTRGVTGGALYPVTVTLGGISHDVQLRTGLTASAEVEVRRVDGELVVPTSALLRRGGAEVVFVVLDDITHEVPVEVLAIGDQDAAVAGDLTDGDEVVTIGVELVEDGAELPR